MSSWISTGLRLAHLAGLAGFAGTLFGLAVIGVQHHPDAAASLVRGAMLPALGLAVLSGAGLAWHRRLDPRRHPWMALHGALAFAALAAILGVLAPAADLLAALADMHGGDMAMPAYAALAGRAWAGLGLALALTLVLVMVAIARRPRLRQNARPDAQNAPPKARTPASTHEFPS